MPYKCEKINYKDGQKASQKLTKEQKREIYLRYKNGDISQRRLAAEYGVSRRTIQFTVDPEKLKDNLIRRKETGGSKQYYNKEAHRDYMKVYRKRKQGIFLKGELVEDAK